MGYFDNLDNESLKKKKIEKIEFFYKYVLLPLDWWSVKFYVISLSFDSPSMTINFHIIYNGSNLMIFDELSNDNEITWNLNDHQFKSRRTHL
jgi:hypothetical protein